MLPSVSPRIKLVGLVALAMLAFAANSWLCRMALLETAIDAALFSSIRLLAGAVTLTLLVRWRYTDQSGHGNYPSALALCVYVLCFSLAYRDLSAGTGALLLFAAVQISMIAYGIWRGECLYSWQVFGLMLAFSGLLLMVLPGVSTPPVSAALLMLLAGCAWGVYSLRGQGAGHPTRVSAGNFVRAVPLVLLVNLLLLPNSHWDSQGAAYAVASGALASGLGYALWYAALPGLSTATAASVQLSVPLITAVGGVWLLGEVLTLRLVLAALLLLVGIAMVVWVQARAAANK